LLPLPAANAASTINSDKNARLLVHERESNLFSGVIEVLGCSFAGPSTRFDYDARERQQQA
jgi:hypothetical protein